jgi:hypothetical protein
MHQTSASCGCCPVAAADLFPTALNYACCWTVILYLQGWRDTSGAVARVHVLRVENVRPSDGKQLTWSVRPGFILKGDWVS